MPKHALPMFPWFPRDVFSDLDYRRLPAGAKALYRELLDAQWMNAGEPIPLELDELSTLVTLRESEVLEHADRVLAEPFFEVVDGGWSNARVARDYAKAAAAKRRLTDAGRAGAAARWTREQRCDRISDRRSDRICDGNATQHSTEEQISCSSSNEHDDAADEHRDGKASSVPDEVVEAIYQAHPRKVGKRRAKAAIRRDIREGADPDLVLERTRQFASSPAGRRGKFTKHASTWFSQSCWADDPAIWQEKTGDEARRAGTHVPGSPGVRSSTDATPESLRPMDPAKRVSRESVRDAVARFARRMDPKSLESEPPSGTSPPGNETKERKDEQQ